MLRRRRSKSADYSTPRRRLHHGSHGSVGGGVGDDDDSYYSTGRFGVRSRHKKRSPKKEKRGRRIRSVERVGRRRAAQTTRMATATTTTTTPVVVNHYHSSSPPAPSSTLLYRNEDEGDMEYYRNGRPQNDVDARWFSSSKRTAAEEKYGYNTYHHHYNDQEQALPPPPPAAAAAFDTAAEFSEFSSFASPQSHHKKYTLAAMREIETLAAKRGFNPLDERFRVVPDDAYPNTYLTRKELRQEMNAKSEYFHDLRVRSKRGQEIGQLRLEVLQCFGIPTTSVLRSDPSAYCIAVCGNHAFKTDVMPSVANPMWLCKMRRAALFPVLHAYANLYLGVFDNSANEHGSNDFVGRIVIDLARLRGGCMYDFTLPLRRSAHVFSRHQQGAIRVRIHLTYQVERAALMSYFPTNFGKPKFVPNEEVTVHCLDERAFKNVAHVVHGSHMPGKFSMQLLKATIREVNFTRIHILRYLPRQEFYNLRFWVYPFLSGFVFCAWMHSLWYNTVRYIPGHILTYLLLHLYKNYAYYGMESKLQNGFLAPTIEEMLRALVWGTKRQKYIEPLNMEMDESQVVNPLTHLETDEDYEDSNPGKISLSEVAEAMRKSIWVRSHKFRFRTYKNCFTGTEAVDFLTSFGFAYSRSEAVFLGKRLAREVKLFEHVTRQHDFEDKDLFYHFLEYDTKKYVIKTHQPQGKALFRAIGFLKDEEVIAERGHVEFPFAKGVDHPRFTVKESLVVRSAESKRIWKERQDQEEVADCAEFGIIQSEHHGNVVGDIGRMGAHVVTGAVTGTVGVGVDIVKAGVGVVRRASIGGTKTTTQGDASAASPQDLQAESKHEKQKRSSMDLVKGHFEHGDPNEIYEKLAARNNPTLDAIIRDRLDAQINDNHAYDSDVDVDEVIQLRRKGYIVEEKLLKKPPNQDMNVKLKHGDKSIPKVMREVRHTAHGLLFHLFNTRAYRIDTNVFPQSSLQDKDRHSVGKKKEKKRGRFGKRIIVRHKDDEKEKKKKTQTPFDKAQDAYDKILGINNYSHGNPMLNRIGAIIQPVVEIIQGFLCLFRATFNIFTWQDPILSFWIAFVGPMVVFMLHIMPYRLLFGCTGLYLVGPQNYLWRLFKESRPEYQPPNFDKIIKKKKPKPEDNYMDVQFFSSEAPGNQTIKYVNVEARQVKKAVVPYGRLKFNRFYDWPPEPQYARVYAAPPPRNNLFSHPDSEDEETMEGTRWLDPAIFTMKKKKKKKGVKKVAAKIKKGTGTVVVAGSELVNKTRITTVGAVKGTVDLTASAVKGTAKVTKSAVKGTGGLLGLRRRKKDQFDYDNHSYH